MITLSPNHYIADVSMIIDHKFIRLVEKKIGDNNIARCHFYTRKVKDFEITLRLDWGDLDKNGDPTLDADIYKNKQKYIVGRKQWHHTLKSLENGEFVYKWKPDVEELRNLSVGITFKLLATNQVTVSGKACIAAPNYSTKISLKQREHYHKILKQLTG